MTTFRSETEAMNIRILIVLAALLAWLIFVVLCITGCAAIAPERVNLEAQHTSHASQHFGPDQTNYGYEAIGADVRWQYGRAALDLFEGATLGTCGEYAGRYSCDGLYGPRETFNARIDYAIWSRP
jgi:hypothetical protein